MPAFAPARSDSRPHVLLRRLVWAAAAVLLTLPAVAMLFTTEVNWDPEDFVIGGALLFGTAFVLDRVLGSRWNRKTVALVAGVVLLVLVFVWAELAVGLVGSPWAGN